jgi:hypothetical protein
VKSFLICAKETMQNQEGPQPDGETEAATSIPTSELDDWANFGDDDIMHQQTAIRAEEAEKTLFVGDKVRATITF